MKELFSSGMFIIILIIVYIFFMLYQEKETKKLEKNECNINHS